MAKSNDNKDYRDYKIIFISGGEKQTYYGSVRVLLEDYPDADIISVKKLVRK